MENSVDPDQMASGETIWSGSALFSKAKAYPGSAEQGLILAQCKKNYIKTDNILLIPS